MPETLYLVDTFSLIFQVFHAIRQPMSGTRGQPTNAVYGFTGDLRHLLNEMKATHLVCGMESCEPGARGEIYADYKANRSEIPHDLAPQIPMILEVIAGYGIPSIECAGWEADDVIATLTRRAVQAGAEVCIVSSDKDLRQLLGPGVRMYNIRKRQYLDAAGLEADWGVRPDQVVDFQALVGDSIDNVPGVPLVGPKKAAALLQQFGTLDEVLAHADEAPGQKLRENLKAYADQARMSRELVRLKVDLPLEFELERARVRPPDCTRLLELFTDFGFRRYADEVRAAAAEAKVEEPLERTWTVVRSEREFQKFVEEFRRQRRFCLNLETTGRLPMEAELLGWSFCWEAGRAWYLPVAGADGERVLDEAKVLAAVKPLLEDSAIEICGHNIKHDVLVLRRLGVEVRGLGVDPMIADYLLDAGARTHDIEKLAPQYLHRRLVPADTAAGNGSRQKRMFETGIDVDRAAQRATEDADLTWQLAEALTTELKNQKLWDLYWDLERPLIPVLAEMEYHGVKVDVAELKRQSAALDERLHELIAEIHALAGREFNIDSPKQLAVVLFDELKLPVQRKTKTGAAASTNQEVLERLALEHPLPAKIIEHRQLSKLKGTYLDALPQMVNPHTGKIHASFNQVVAATGRLSSSDPNLQNIPIRAEEGRRVRKAFVPSEPGWKLLCADYSQIELRMLAHFCRDPALIAAFTSGTDVHTAVAAEIFGVDPRDVEPGMRRIAKAVNFGVIYGQSAFGLATALGIPREEAQTFIENYFERHAGVARYMGDVLDECDRTGYARTILGRRREIVGIRSKRRGQLNLAERTAVNAGIQGSAADLIKRAMIAIHRRLADERHPARMLLQIHDELVFETPAGEVTSLAELVRGEMERALELSVPLVVDVSVGDNWLEKVQFL